MSETENNREHEAGMVERAKETMAAGASGLMEVTRGAVHKTHQTAGRAAEVVRNADIDAELKGTVAQTTERTLDRAGDVVGGAAPAIGRGAQRAAETVGAALHVVAGPLGAIVGAIAGVVGGWWKEASGAAHELPEAEEQACRAHFTAIAVRPAGITFDQARTGYALGYIAARNPGYRGRRFEEVESDLRHGFGGGRANDYDSLREFVQYGYGRGTGATSADTGSAGAR